jgi:hypothetical protein
MAAEEPTIIYSRDGQRRVVVHRRDADSFSFYEKRYSDHPLEQCWIPFGRRSHPICDTADTALREAIDRVNWLRELDDSVPD